MKRYIKFSGDNCILGNFTRNKAYEVVSIDRNNFGANIVDNRSREIYVLIGQDCSYLDDKEAWKFCDEHGNELDEKKKQVYKGQFDLADGDVTVWWGNDGYIVNITKELKRIAEIAG